MNRISIILALLTGVLFMFSRCEYEHFEPGITVDSVSFSKDVIPILNNSCLGSGCHSVGGASPVLTADFAYINLVDGGFVIPEEPENSKLYQRMISSSKPMPPSGKLKNVDLQIIEVWIKKGALNN